MPCNFSLTIKVDVSIDLEIERKVGYFLNNRRICHNFNVCIYYSCLFIFCMTNNYYYLLETFVPRNNFINEKRA